MILLRIRVGNDPDKEWTDNFDPQRPLRQKFVEIIERRKMTGDLADGFSIDRVSVEHKGHSLSSLDVRPIDIPNLQPLDILTVWDSASELRLNLISHPDKEPSRTNEIHVDPRRPLNDQASFIDCLENLAKGRTFRRRKVHNGKFKLFWADSGHRMERGKNNWGGNQKNSCEARVEPNYFLVWPPWRYQVIVVAALLVVIVLVGVFLLRVPKEYHVRFLAQEGTRASVVIKSEGRALDSVIAGSDREVTLPHGVYELEIMPERNPIFTATLILPPDSNRRESKQEYVIDAARRFEKSERFCLLINGFLGIVGDRIGGLEINGFPVELQYLSEACLDSLPVGEYEIRYPTEPDSALNYYELANCWDRRRPWLTRFDRRTFRWDFRNCSAGDTARVTFVYKKVHR